MRRGWLSLLFALILVGMSQTQALAIYESSPYVYRLKVANCSQAPQARVLTGFRVQGIDGIITALHGVIGCESITARSDDKNNDNIFRNLTIQQVDIERDVALLWSTDMDRAPAGGLAAAPAEPPIGDLRVMGYPKGLSSQRPLVNVVLLSFPQLTERIPDNDPSKEVLYQRRSPSLEITVLDLQTSLLPGHSGAPLLTADGKVYGVANGGLDEGTIEISWAIPWSQIEWRPIEMEQARLTELTLNSPLSDLNFSSTFPDYDIVELDSQRLPMEAVRSYRASAFMYMNGRIEGQDVESWLGFETAFNEAGNQGSLLGVNHLHIFGQDLQDYVEEEEAFLIFSNQDQLLRLAGFEDDCFQLDQLPEEIGPFVEQVGEMISTFGDEDAATLGTYLGTEEINGVNTHHYLLSDSIPLELSDTGSPLLEMIGVEIWVTVETNELRKIIYEVAAYEDSSIPDQAFAGNVYVEIEYSDINTDLTVELPLACRNVSPAPPVDAALENGQALITEPIPVEHNVSGLEGPGLLIKPTLTVSDRAAGPGLAIVRVFDEFGLPLLTYSPATGALDSIYQAQAPFTPPLDSEEFEIFVPYQALALLDGVQDLKFRLFVYDLATKMVLAESGSYDFSLWQQTDEAGNRTWLSDHYAGLRGLTVAGQAEISPLEQDVGQFLSHAFEAETWAYFHEDPAVAEPYFGGQALVSLQESIEEFQQQGLVWYANFDEQNSFMVNMTVIAEGVIEVDLCGFWRAGTVSDKSDQPVLEEYFIPQTVTLEKNGGRWWSITAVDYPDNTVCEFE